MEKSLVWSLQVRWNALGWCVHTVTTDGGMSSLGSPQQSSSFLMGLSHAPVFAEGQKGKGVGVMEGPILFVTFCSLPILGVLNL